MIVNQETRMVRWYFTTYTALNGRSQPVTPCLQFMATFSNVPDKTMPEPKNNSVPNIRLISIWHLFSTSWNITIDGPWFPTQYTLHIFIQSLVIPSRFDILSSIIALIWRNTANVSLFTMAKLMALPTPTAAPIIIMMESNAPGSSEWYTR